MGDVKAQALLDELIAPWARRTPDGPAVISQGRTCSYALFATDIGRCIARLAEEALPEGAVVLVDTPDAYMFWALALACEALGLTACAAPPGGTTSALVALIAPDLRIATDGQKAPGVRSLSINSAFAQDLAARRPAPPPQRDRPGDERVLLLLTSGTTGELKAVAVTRQMLGRRNAQFAAATPRADRSGARTLSLVGPWSLAGVLPAFNAWRLGGVLGSTEGRADWVEAVAEFKPDHLFLAPVHLQALLAHARGGPPPSRPHVFAIGGTPGTALLARAEAEFSPNLWVCYGATEIGVAAGAHLDDLGASRDAAGRLWPWTDAEVLDDAGAPLPPGEPGELRVRLDGMAHSYLGQPTDALRSGFRDGWFHPGDVAAIDTDRVLRVLGRTDDLLHLGGAKVLPSALERIVEAQDGVAECAAFTAPDADGLETPYVAVAASEAFSPAAAAQALVASLGRAVRLVRVDVLPRNGLGKVERTKLRAVMMERAARQAADEA